MTIEKIYIILSTLHKEEQTAGYICKLSHDRRGIAKAWAEHWVCYEKGLRK